MPGLARLAARRRPRIQPQLRQDLAEHRTLQDRRDDLHLPGAAPRAVPHVDVEDPLEQPRPADAAGPGLNRLDFALGANRCFGGRWLLCRRRLRHPPRPQLRVGRQHPVVPDQVQLRPRHPRRQRGSPAHAGIDLNRAHGDATAARLPRACGDRPGSTSYDFTPISAPPHKRGPAQSALDPQCLRRRKRPLPRPREGRDARPPSSQRPSETSSSRTLSIYSPSRVKLLTESRNP